MDQFIDFCQEKYIPESEKIYEGMKSFMMKCVRGEHKNSIGFIVQFVDEASRDKYYNSDGGLNDLGVKTQEKLAPILTEMEKIGTMTSEYTDWILL